ncbi:glycosyltransferase family 4 protein [Mucilaginibacter sp.]|uniref:glycosyltransferase family 4 protein n=1 Tax=Mucilaginibacter sp. TaxID=1882438 RepID=UPI002604683E|nr:glycosyltransferase family 4 protein [Mucilaginibacter sp.]MDB4927120.1 glycosyltransferase [Mucilaginibacter sp.]
MAFEILSLTKDLDEFGGAQKVLVDIHRGIKNKHNAKVLGFSKFGDIHPKYKIDQHEYVKFTNPFYLNNKLLIVHDRRIITFIMTLKRLFFLNTKVLYVSHCVYDTLNWASMFPDDIISISGKVTDNLINYFGLKERNIRLIYNGIKDYGNTTIPYKKKDKIVILYSAKIYNLKRQLEIVDNLTNKLLPEIEIHFAGTGPDYQQLIEKCKHSSNFKPLGFIENINELINDVNYLMLFSIREGLPISLIEGIMRGKPILANDVGGNLEICIPGENGILLDDSWDRLADTLNKLVLLSEEEYLKMSLNSRKRYESMFTYEKMVSMYLDVIKQMQQN